MTLYLETLVSRDPDTWGALREAAAIGVAVMILAALGSLFVPASMRAPDAVTVPPPGPATATRLANFVVDHPFDDPAPIDRVNTRDSAFAVIPANPAAATAPCGIHIGTRPMSLTRPKLNICWA